MGIDSVLQICGMKMPSAAAAATSSSVNNSIVSGAAAHRPVQDAAERLSWKNLRQGGACLLPIQKSCRPHSVERKKRTVLTPPCSSSAESSSSSSSSSMFEGVDSNQNVAGASVSSSIMQSTLLRLHKAGIIACLRTTSADVALNAARAALDGGLTVVEVTMTTPSAATVIESLVREYPSATIGAGTVLSEHEAEMAKQAGAKFLTSPVTLEIYLKAHRVIKPRGVSTTLRQCGESNSATCELKRS